MAQVKQEKGMDMYDNLVSVQPVAIGKVVKTKKVS